MNTRQLSAKAAHDWFDRT